MEGSGGAGTRVIDVVHELGVEGHAQFAQTGITVLEGIGRIVQRGVLNILAVGASIGEEQVPGRLGHRSASVVAGVKAAGGRLVVGVLAELVGCGQGEDQLGAGLGL